MQVFLTGASGYIGSAVAQALRKAGHTVVGLARSEDQMRMLAARGLGGHRGDLRDPSALAEGVCIADAVIHASLSATPDAPQVDRAAVRAILDELNQFNRPFIYTSGCWVLGNTGDSVADENTPLAPTPLVAWRPVVEQMVLDAARQGVQGIVLRPAVVYGRGGGLVQFFVDSAGSRALPASSATAATAGLSCM